MVASNCWPLGKKQPEFTIEMVNMPIFGPTKEVPFPLFGIELKKGEDKKSFTAMVEDSAQEIVGKITDKEYLARKAARGIMPWLNRVLEELGIHHEEHKVPPEVLDMIEKKAAAKNAMAAAQLKKRKGIRASKVVPKKQKISMASPTSAASSISGSARASTNAVEVSAENSGWGPTEAVMEVEKIDALEDIGGQRVEGVDRPEPSA
jgi:low affinity Fe/Cu permease